jgi:glycosyltransferase involved in cell wall biosynthesis
MHASVERGPARRGADAGPEIVVLHAVESFAGGTLTSVARLVHSLGEPFRHIILHGLREDSPADFADRLPSHTRLIRWHVDRAISLRGDARALRELERVLKETRPAIIHAHSSKAGAICRMSSGWRTSAVLYSPHSYAFQQTDVSALQRKALWGCEFALARRPHITVACGASEYALARRLGRRVVQINNMVDLSDIGPLRAQHTLHGPLRVAMLAHIAPRKNFPLFVEVARACETRGYQFTWIGGGDLQRDLPLPANVTVTGMLPHGRALETLAQSHVYMHTAAWEGLAIAVLEAMALAMPVVVSSASSEVVMTDPERRNGEVCDTVDHYVAALARFVEAPGTIAEFGRNSRAIVEARYVPEVVLAQWRALYLEASRASGIAGVMRVLHQLAPSPV